MEFLDELASLIPAPDFTAGQQGWVHVGAGDPTWGQDGAVWDAPNATSTTLFRFYYPQAISLLAGHRYAIWADFDIVDLGGVEGQKMATFSPFVNGLATAFPTKRVPLDTPSRVASVITATESGTYGNCYFSVGLPIIDASGNPVNPGDIRLTVRAVMLVDLGDSTSRSYSFGDAELGDAIWRLGGRPYYPKPHRLPRFCYSSVVAKYADRANESDHAIASDTAGLADAVKTGWEGKRILTIGHSLVSQLGWQGQVLERIGLAGYSSRGISGGTLQPKDGGISGFFSRSYFQDVIANSTNVTTGQNNSTGLAGLDISATIIWLGANDGIAGLSNGSHPLALESGADRPMTIAEQDELEASVASNGAATALSSALSTGLTPTYFTLYMTAIRNFYEAMSFSESPGHQLFMVREPQAFWEFDGTLHWPEGHYQKNEIHKKVSDRFGIPLIDLWQTSSINMRTRGLYLAIESNGDLMIHLNDKGQRQIGRNVAEFLKSYPPVDFSGTVSGTILPFPPVLDPWNQD